MDKDKLYWLGFSVFSGIGPMKFQLLLKRFGTAKHAWDAPLLDLSELLGEKLAVKFDSFRDGFSPNSYTRILLAQGVSLLTVNDREYPLLLKQIKNPPFVLYVKGPLKTFENSKMIAVVGTRKITQYGKDVTQMFVQELVLQGFTIVSGLAIGVDGIAHKTAIENSGSTIAVLGCGVDCCFPKENLHIYNSIANGRGCIVSELPLGRSPTKGSFPSRNRIIAGLSLGVLVTEGAEDSGSLITADYAFRCNRPVFAVPGPITSSLSKGPYKLIQKGARLVTKGDDIIQELGIRNYELGNKQQAIRNKKKGETKEEEMILELLEHEPLTFDEIVRCCGLDSSKVGAVLSMMEIKGMIKSIHSGVYTVNYQ